MFAVMLLISVTTVVCGMAFSGNLGFFFDPPSVVFVFIPSISLSVGAHGWNNFKAIFSGYSSDPTPLRARELESVARSCGNNFFLFGWLGMFVGALQLLSQVEQWKSVGPACAVMLLTMIYGFCIKALVFNPLADKYGRISCGTSDFPLKNQ